MKKGYVYILESESNGRYYIGSAEDLELRLWQHNNGEVTATRNKGPWVVTFNQEFDTIREARQIEYKLKKLKNKNIIKQIIEEGFIKIKP